MKSPAGLVLVLLAGCGGGASDAVDGGPTADASAGGADAGDIDGAPGEDFDMKASDFECILRWPKVRGFRITNKLGHENQAVALANANTGGVYPVGTLIQLVPFEAMIKRRAGFSAATHDWEFFSLSVSSSGTTIRSRGTDTVVNQFGGNCLSCHSKAMPQWDLICETNHGCDPLPLTASQIATLQMNDARCP